MVLVDISLVEVVIWTNQTGIFIPLRHTEIKMAVGMLENTSYEYGSVYAMPIITKILLEEDDETLGCCYTCLIFFLN